MRSILSALGLLDCCKYNNDKDLLDLARKQVCDLEGQITGFITQIQELKAINDYQCFQLERKIAELEQDNVKLKSDADSWKKKFFNKLKSNKNKVESTKNG